MSETEILGSEQPTNAPEERIAEETDAIEDGISVSQEVFEPVDSYDIGDQQEADVPSDDEQSSMGEKSFVDKVHTIEPVVGEPLSESEEADTDESELASADDVPTQRTLEVAGATIVITSEHSVNDVEMLDALLAAIRQLKIYQR